MGRGKRNQKNAGVTRGFFYVLTVQSQYMSSRTKMMMPVVLIVGVMAMFSSALLFGGLLLLSSNKDTMSSPSFQDDNVAYSQEFGRRGEREYGAVCGDGRSVKKVLLTTKDIGPRVVGKRHARIDKLGVQCSDGSKSFGVGESADMTTESSCKTGKMIGFRSFTTDAALQRIEPICEGYGQFTNSSALGKNIGDNNKYVCPAGMYLTGFTGTVSQQLNSIKARCSK
jgi:hypothetical protein